MPVKILLGSPGFYSGSDVLSHGSCCGISCTSDYLDFVLRYYATVIAIVITENHVTPIKILRNICRSWCATVKAVIC